MKRSVKAPASAAHEEGGGVAAETDHRGLPVAAVAVAMVAAFVAALLPLGRRGGALGRRGLAQRLRGGHGLRTGAAAAARAGLARLALGGGLFLDGGGGFGAGLVGAGPVAVTAAAAGGPVAAGRAVAAVAGLG